MSIMQFQNVSIDNQSPAFIIAELSANHGGSIDIAKKTIDAAKEAGANAVKLQTYTADTLTIDCDNEYFRLNSGTIWDGKTLYELYKEAYTPWEWHKELFNYAEKAGIICFSTPFDKSAVDFLEQYNVPAYKIASFEIVDTPLIRYAASKGKPMVISTGTADICDIANAVKACHSVGNHDIILLQCSSQYPAKIEDANLAMLQCMANTFGVITGLSDHTIGSVLPVVAVTLGARVIEKHFILDKSIKGPDSSFSMDKEEFSEMVEAVRIAEKSIGKVDFSLTGKKRTARNLGRSLFVVKDIKKGECVSEDNVRSIRPGIGISPKFYDDVIGKKVNANIKRGTPLDWKYF